MQFPTLARPINIGKVALKNRLVAQCCVMNLANENGTVSPRLKEHYREQGRVRLVGFSHPSYPGAAYNWSRVNSSYLLNTYGPMKSAAPEQAGYTFGVMAL